MQSVLSEKTRYSLPSRPFGSMAPVVAAVFGLCAASAFGQQSQPTFESPEGKFELQPSLVQTDPETAPTLAYDTTVPSWYARGAALILFPQDVTIGNAGDFTLGWGGGLNFAGGYSFNAGGDVSPRVELEYILLLDEFRDLGTTDGITWNSLGVNGLVDFRVRDGFKLYGGAGAGLTYVSADAGTTSDNNTTFYLQALGGGLFRFSDDIEIDIGIRYTIASPDLFGNDIDLNNILFHVGLLLRLE